MLRSYEDSIPKVISPTNPNPTIELADITTLNMAHKNEIHISYLHPKEINHNQEQSTTKIEWNPTSRVKPLEL